MERYYPVGMLPVIVAMVIVGVFALVGSAIDGACNRLVYLLMVRPWVPRRTFRGAKPPRLQIWAAERLYELSVAISRGNAALDRIISRVLVDVWWSAEPTKVTPKSQRPKAGFTSVAYWAADMDKRWDQATTSVMVDMWVPEPGETVTLDAQRPARPVVSQELVARRRRPVAKRPGRINALHELCDRLVRAITVQAWLPESLTAETARQIVEGEKASVSRDKPPEPVGPPAVERKPLPESARVGAPGTSVGKPENLSEALRLVQDWTRGPGRTVWRVVLVVMGTAVVIVTLLVALGYLNF